MCISFFLLVYHSQINLNFNNIKDKYKRQCLIIRDYKKHLQAGFNGDNSLVSYYISNSVYTDSRIGRNIRYLAYKCLFDIQDLIKLTYTDFINRVYDEWEACVKVENVRVAEQGKELVYVRNRIDECLLEKGKSMTLLIIFALTNEYVIICISVLN